MRQLVINRSIWLRGEGPDASRLLRESDGKQCCVGIYLQACGVDAEVLLEKSAATSVSVTDALPDEAKWLVSKRHGEYLNSGVSSTLYNENDDEYLEGREEVTEEEFEARREDSLKIAFAAKGVEITFED